METDDPRTTANTEGEGSDSPTGRKSPILFPLINSSFIPGHCLEAVQAIEDAKERDIAMGEYYYFSGHPEEAAMGMELYLASEDTATRLSACLVYA
ncbi:MAG: hypothetical protein LIP11_06555, partial [Clostridiales bacterium]|nr:hypothetical protein [Clostridiales bacterium]